MKRKPEPPRPASSANGTDQPDEEFLEYLFAAMCRAMRSFPGESFVTQVRQWMNAWRVTAALRPRNEQEWLQAAVITTKRSVAAYHMLMHCQPRLTRQQRAYHQEGYILATRAAVTALKHYREMRDPGAA